MRIHRSAVVNVERIVEPQPSFHGEHVAILYNGRRPQVSRERRDGLARALGARFLRSLDGGSPG